MTSVGTPELVVGSVSSVYSIRDTIESCQCVQHWHGQSSPFDTLFGSCFIVTSTDRRLQLMSSTSRVVSVVPRTDDEPSFADDNEENSGTRTQPAFVHDLHCDEDEPVIPAYSSFRQHDHTPNVSRRASEVQTPTCRSHVSMDERSPLLSRVTVVSEAVPAGPQPTAAAAAWHSPNPVPAKSPAIGQSTFSQTVSHLFCLCLPSS
jgi:hypothetical protein